MANELEAARDAVAAARAHVAQDGGSSGGDPFATLGRALFQLAACAPPQDVELRRSAEAEAHTVLREGAAVHGEVAAMSALAEAEKRDGRVYWELYWRDRAVRASDGKAGNADALFALGQTFMTKTFLQAWATSAGGFLLRRILFRAFTVAVADAAGSARVDLDALVMPGSNVLNTPAADDPGWMSGQCEFSGSPQADADAAAESLRAAVMDGVAMLELAAAAGSDAAADLLVDFWRVWKDPAMAAMWTARAVALRPPPPTAAAMETDTAETKTDMPKLQGALVDALSMLGGSLVNFPPVFTYWEASLPDDTFHVLHAAVMERAATVVAAGDIDLVLRTASELQKSATSLSDRRRGRAYCGLLTIAMDAGSVAAAFDLGRAHLRPPNNGFPDAVRSAQQSTDAIAPLKRAAERGHARAMVYLGDLLMRWAGESKCAEMDERAVFPEACVSWAHVFQVGLGWMLKAADADDAIACLYLGLVYDRHDYVAPDFGRAVAFYQRAADRGSAAAKFLLALYYDAGVLSTDDDSNGGGGTGVAADPSPRSSLEAGTDTKKGASTLPTMVNASPVAVARVEALLATAAAAAAASTASGPRLGSARAASLVKEAAAQGFLPALSLLADWQIRGNHVGVERNVCAAARYDLQSQSSSGLPFVHGLTGRASTDGQSGPRWSTTKGRGGIAQSASEDASTMVDPVSVERLFSVHKPWIELLVRQSIGDDRVFWQEVNAVVSELRKRNRFGAKVPVDRSKLLGYHGLEVRELEQIIDFNETMVDPLESDSVVASSRPGDASFPDDATRRATVERLQAKLVQAAAVGSQEACFVLALQHERAAKRARRRADAGKEERDLKKGEQEDSAALLDDMAMLLYERGLRWGSAPCGIRLVFLLLHRGRQHDPSPALGGGGGGGGVGDLDVLVRVLESLQDLDGPVVWPMLVRLIADGQLSEFGGVPVDRAWAARLLEWAAADATVAGRDCYKRTQRHIDEALSDPISDDGARVPPTNGAALLMAAESSRWGYLGAQVHPRRTVALLVEAANAGSMDAISHLGRAFEAGDVSLPRDHARAVLLYGIALDGGSPFGSLHLGRLHLLGRGVSLHYGRAERLLADAATKLGAEPTPTAAGATRLSTLLESLADVVAAGVMNAFPDLSTAAELYELAVATAVDRFGDGVGIEAAATAAARARCAGKVAAMYRRAQLWTDEGSPGRARLAELAQHANNAAVDAAAQAAAALAATPVANAEHALASDMATLADDPWRWAQLAPELLEHILRMLPLDDWLQCRRVCAHWKEVVDAHRAADLVAAYRCHPFGVVRPADLVEPETAIFYRNEHYLAPLWLDALVSIPVLCQCGAIVLDALYRFNDSDQQVLDWEAFTRHCARTYAHRHLGQLPPAPWSRLVTHERIATDLMDLADRLCVAVWVAGTTQANNLEERRLRDKCFVGYNVPMPIDLPWPRTDAAMRDLVAAIIFGAPGWNQARAAGTPVIDLASHQHPIWSVGTGLTATGHPTAAADTFFDSARRTDDNGTAVGGRPVHAVESVESLVLKYEAVLDAFRARAVSQTVARFLDEHVGACEQLREATGEEPKAVLRVLTEQVAVARSVAAFCRKHLTNVVVGSVDTPDLALLIAGFDRHGALIITVSDARVQSP